jgi:hypothetical protein
MMKSQPYRLFLLGAALASAGCSATDQKVGESAPDFKLDSLGGQSVTLSQYRGNVVLLGFWAVG